jgi:hypothetical protein
MSLSKPMSVMVLSLREWLDKTASAVPGVEQLRTDGNMAEWLTTTRS